jgi:hypothetical protein
VKLISILSPRYYIGLAIVPSIVTIGWLSFSYLTKPALLRIAVGPEDAFDFRKMTMFAHILELHRSNVRLQPVATSEPQENSAALERGTTKLAILRADQGLPGHSSVVVIPRKNLPVVVARAKLELDIFSELTGKRLGIVSRSPLGEEGYAKLLLLYGMQKSDIKSRIITADRVGPLTDNGQLDAVMIFGPLVDPEVSGVVYAVDPKKNPLHQSGYWM